VIAWQSCLRRLARHVDLARAAVTGSVAIDVQLAPGTPRRRPRDLDLVAEVPDVVSPTVAEEFLVSHFHLPQSGYAKFLIQLVCPESRVRVDIFPDVAGALATAPWRTLGDLSFRMLAPRTVLEHKLALIARASPSRRLDEKHHADAVSLAQICGGEVPAMDPEAFEPTLYSRDLNLVCPRCEVSRDPRFPLAAKRAIFDVLGYV
jgi:hypothetical protein